MNAATSSEQQHLADAIGTSRAMLYQYASGHREVSAARGGEIEAVSKLMFKVSKGRLPVLYRTDLVAACRACDYAQKCLGSIAVASEFPIVEALQSDQATG
jgi:hypothetical protein